MEKNEKLKSIFIILVALLPFIILLNWEFVHNILNISGIRRIIEDIPYLGFAILGYMGWKLNQTRVVIITSLLVVVFFIQTHMVTEEIVFGSLSTLEVMQIFSLAVPFGIILTLGIKEGAFTSLRGVLKVVAISTPMAIFFLIALNSYSFFSAVMNHQILVISWYEVTIIPQWGLVFLALSTIGLFLLKKETIKDFMQRLPIVLPAFIFSLYIVGESGWDMDTRLQGLGLSYSSLVVVLVFSIFKLYWQRVYIDELTQIPNRRALDECLEFMSGDYSVAMIDVDHFKKFNDTYGHERGDEVLRFVGALLKKDPHGRAFRYGGEEFCLVFKGAGIKRAFAYSDLFRESLYSTVFYIRSPEGELHFLDQVKNFFAEWRWRKVRQDVEDVRDRRMDKSLSTNRGNASPTQGKECKISVSIGVSGTSVVTKNPYEILRQADQALYRAKERGRNMVIKYENQKVVTNSNGST